MLFVSHKTSAGASCTKTSSLEGRCLAASRVIRMGVLQDGQGHFRGQRRGWQGGIIPGAGARKAQEAFGLKYLQSDALRSERTERNGSRGGTLPLALLPRCLDLSLQMLDGRAEPPERQAQDALPLL